MRVLVLCCVGVLLAGCGGPSTQTMPSRAATRAQPPPAAAKPAGTIAGTTWTWSDGKTVEFLRTGRVRYSNYVHGGNWQQDGNAVTFDQNGVVLFSVVVAGDVMRGSWRALKGDDTRVTTPTSLKRTD